jgi:methionine sulfoxide reductase heme-binding subunit
MIQILERYLKKPRILVVLFLIPLSWTIFEFLLDPIKANPLQELLISTGDTAAWMLVILLWISPLNLMFPSLSLLRTLQSQKRILGLGVFCYVLIHLILYLVDRSELLEIVEDFSRIFLLSGIVAFLILLILAFTSTNQKIRKLGAKRWKLIHRTVYVAAGLVFCHMLLKEKSDPLEAWLLFLPLTFAEIFRLLAWLRKRKSH